MYTGAGFWNMRKLQMSEKKEKKYDRNVLTILHEPSWRRPCPAWITAMVCSWKQIKWVEKS